MAKKQNNDLKTGLAVYGCGIIMIIIMVIGVLLKTAFVVVLKTIPLIVPIVFLFCCIYNIFMYNREDKKHIKSGFQLTEYEKSRLSEVKYNLSWAYDKKEECKGIIQNEGLRFRKDGRLSQKNYRAQDVQGALDNADKIISDNYPVYEMLCGLPNERYKSARKHFSKYTGFAFAFVLWLGMLFSYDNPNSAGIIAEIRDYVVDIKKTAKDGTHKAGEIMHRGLGKKDNTKNVKDSSSVVKQTIEKEDNIAEKQEDVSVEMKDESFADHFVKIFWVLVISYIVVRLLAMVYFMIKIKKPMVIK